MAEQRYQQSTRDRHALGDFRSHLVTEPLAGATKQPRLSLYYHRNKVVIEVRTNLPADMNGKDRGVIRAELEPHIFFSFLSLLQRVIHQPPAQRPESIRIKRPDFNKSNGGEPVTEATLVVGKTQDGIVYMSLLSYNKERPKIMFPFLPGKWVEFVGNDGQPKSKAEISEIFAAGLLREWESLVPHYLYNRYVAESYEKSDAKSGGNKDMRSEEKADKSFDWDDNLFG